MDKQPIASLTRRLKSKGDTIIMRDKRIKYEFEQELVDIDQKLYEAFKCNKKFIKIYSTKHSKSDIVKHLRNMNYDCEICTAIFGIKYIKINLE